MQNQKSISNANDPWFQSQATESLIKAYQSTGNDGRLTDYVPTRRPQDPTSKTIPGTSDLPAEDPNRIHELNRNTVLVTPDGKTFSNPWAVSDRPVKQRPAQIQIPTPEQVAAELESLKNAVSTAEDQYESDKASRPAIHARMVRIGAELAPLVERVRVLEAELNELKSIPAPEAAFTAATAAHEFAVQQAAGHALEALQENWAQSIFGISFRRNPGNLKGASDSARDDINLGLDALRPYINPHQVRFSRSAHKTVEAARETLKRLETNLDEVAVLLQEKAK